MASRFSFKYSFLAFTFLLLTQQGFSQDCDTTQLEIRQVRASDTDGNIAFELSQHYVYYNPSCASRQTLLLFMAGTFGNPNIYQLFPKLAANNGFHVISLKYPNDVFAYQVCGSDQDVDCYKHYRQEALYGQDVSAGIDIDSTNCILNRSVKLLQYLDQNYPNENWGQFLNGNTIVWSKVMAAGHSQGGGHAAFMGHEFALKRVLMYSGPFEYSTFFNDVAAWFSEARPTPDSSYYGFGSVNDEVGDFTNLHAGWSSMGLSNYGDSTNVAYDSCTYQQHRILYTSRLLSGALTINHGSTVRDEYTPKDNNGQPDYLPVWQYMLGLCEAPNQPNGLMQQSNPTNLQVYPNPVMQSLVLAHPFAVHQNWQIMIRDRLGKTVLATTSTSNNTATIDVSTLPTGLYFYTITSTHAVHPITGKFIKAP